MYEENGVPITRATAGIMASAIISDTLLLRSPTTTDEDHRALEKLAAITGIDPDIYGTELLRAGTALGDAPAETLIAGDAKSYTMGSADVRLAQLNTVDPTEILDRRDEFLTAMQAERERADYDLFLLLVTNVLTTDSDLLVVGSPLDTVEDALAVTINGGHAFATGLVSRKKQLVPQLTRALTGRA